LTERFIFQYNVYYNGDTVKLQTYRKFNGKYFMLDEYTQYGITKQNATARKNMWKSKGHLVRMIEIGNGKYVVYRQYTQ